MLLVKNTFAFLALAVSVIHAQQESIEPTQVVNLEQQNLVPQNLEPQIENLEQLQPNSEVESSILQENVEEKSENPVVSEVEVPQDSPVEEQNDISEAQSLEVEQNVENLEVEDVVVETESASETEDKSDEILEQEIAAEIKSLDSMEDNQPENQEIQTPQEPESQSQNEVVEETDSPQPVEVQNVLSPVAEQPQQDTALDQMKNLMKLLTPEQLAQFQNMNGVKVPESSETSESSEPVENEQIEQVDEIVEDTVQEENSLEEQARIEAEQIENFEVPSEPEKETPVLPENGYGQTQNQQFQQQQPQYSNMPQVAPIPQNIQYPYQQNQQQQYLQNQYPQQNPYQQSVQYPPAQQNPYQQPNQYQNPYQQYQQPPQNAPVSQYPPNQYPPNQYPPSNEYPPVPQQPLVPQQTSQTEKPPQLGYSQQIPEVSNEDQHIEYSNQNLLPPASPTQNSNFERLLEDSNQENSLFNQPPKMISAPGELPPIGLNVEEDRSIFSQNNDDSVLEQPDQQFEGERHSHLQANSAYNSAVDYQQQKQHLQQEIENDALHELSEELPFNIVRKDDENLGGSPEEHFDDLDRHYRKYRIE